MTIETFDKQSSGRLRNRRKGAALVEFAVVFPIVLLIFSTMIEISRVLMLQHTADTAAYEGARNAMVPGATSEEGIIAAQQLLQAAGLRSCTIVFTPTVITEQTPLITVEVEVPIARNAWVVPHWFQNANIKSEVTLVCERPPMVQLTGVPKIKAKNQTLKGTQPTL